MRTMDETTPPLVVELPVTRICGRVGSITIGLISERSKSTKELGMQRGECREQADGCRELDWYAACDSPGLRLVERHGIR
jgi:hypothetical protein